MALQPVNVHECAAQAYDLHHLFPKDDYKKERIVCAHYLILYKNKKGVVEWLNNNPQYLNEKATKFQITPLHLCAIVGDVDTATYLLSKGAHTHELDIRKWTPLHHAALHENSAMLTLLLKIDATKDNPASPLKNENNGTYADLRQWAFPQQISQDNNVFNFRNPHGEIVGGSATQFQEMTGAQFVSQMHSDPAFFINEWKNPTEIAEADLNISASMEKLYLSFLNAPPPLFLDATGASGFGVFSGGEIPKDAVVIDYLGKATHDGGASLYAMTLCDGFEKRNFGPMMNDGFPNSVDMSLCNFKGIPILHVLRAIRPIAQGEQILWNYGHNHPVKVGKYTHLAEEDAIKWLQEKNLLERYKELNNWVRTNTDNVNFSVIFRNYIAPFHYLLCTPSFQVIVLLKRIITIDELYTISKQRYFDERSSVTERSDNLFVRKDLESSFRIVSFFFKFCAQLDNPSQKEQEVVTIVENLFSQMKISSFFGFWETLTADLADPTSFVRPLLTKAIEGNLPQREKLLKMAINFELHPELY